MGRTCLVILAVLFAGSANAAIIEDFETGGFGADWVTVDVGGSVNTSAAHDGSYGFTDPGWAYYTGADGVVSEGSILSAWFQAGTGRFYLGFDSDSSGSKSFVGAPNTGDIRFQDNPNYGFVELTTSSQSWQRGAWYFAEVIFEAGNTAVGNLYASDGITLLNTVTETYSDSFDGGIAIRSFGGFNIDTISLTTASVPEPAGMALFALGLAGLGFARKKGAI